MSWPNPSHWPPPLDDLLCWRHSTVSAPTTQGDWQKGTLGMDATGINASLSRVRVGMRPKANSGEIQGMRNGGGRKGVREKKKYQGSKMGGKFWRIGDGPYIVPGAGERCRRQRMVLGSEASNWETWGPPPSSPPGGHSMRTPARLTGQSGCARQGAEPSGDRRPEAGWLRLVPRSHRYWSRQTEKNEVKPCSSMSSPSHHHRKGVFGHLALSQRRAARLGDNNVNVLTSRDPMTWS